MCPSRTGRCPASEIRSPATRIGLAGAIWATFRVALTKCKTILQPLVPPMRSRCAIPSKRIAYPKVSKYQRTSAAPTWAPRVALGRRSNRPGAERSARSRQPWPGRSRGTAYGGLRRQRRAERRGKLSGMAFETWRRACRGLAKTGNVERDRLARQERGLSPSGSSYSRPVPPVSE